jgi:hypothetical protein
MPWQVLVGQRRTLNFGSAHTEEWVGRGDAEDTCLPCISQDDAALSGDPNNNGPQRICCASIKAAVRRYYLPYLVQETETTGLENLSLKDDPKDVSTLPLNWKWLGEMADTNLVLPVYESSDATVPVAIAPFSRFTDAIRREAASAEPPPVSVSQARRIRRFGLTSNEEIHPCRSPRAVIRLVPVCYPQDYL